MRVILLENVENLGKKWEVKEVADGFAKNFLIPQRLVKPATEVEVKEAELRRAEEEVRAKKELEKVEALVSRLDGYELKALMPVSEDGRLYASVNGEKISLLLEEQGFRVTPKQIRLENPIKELGEFPVTLEFDHGLEAEIRVIVEAAE
jgi:large subunit ribosomal protein L9